MFTGKIPPRVPVVAVVVHLPDDGSAYHRHRGEIVSACLRTARKHAGCDMALVVWDNGSGDEGKRIIADAGPDVVVTTPNMGKINAWKHILKMYSDCTLSVSDDDVLYYPNWMIQQIQVLRAYDNSHEWRVGAVTGILTRQNSHTLVDSTVEWAREHADSLDETADIPNMWDIQHGMSCGRDRESASKYMVGHTCPTMVYNGVAARACGGHTQFLCDPLIIAPLIPYSTHYMMQTFTLFDKALEQSGKLKLATYDRTARHLGNVLTDDDRDEIEGLL